MQTFTVPNGVTSITVDAYGSQGGTNGNLNGGNGGGLGAHTAATFTVTPLSTLNIYVGGQTSNSSSVLMVAEVVELREAVVAAHLIFEVEALLYQIDYSSEEGWFSYSAGGYGGGLSMMLGSYASPSFSVEISESEAQTPSIRTSSVTSRRI